MDVLNSAVCICQNDTGSVCLDFKMNGLYANESLLTDQGTIEVSFFDPLEKYRSIVVVDPRTAEGDEDEAALAVARQLKAMADKDDANGIKLYFTRLENTDVSLDKKLAFIEEAKPDLLVGIETLSSQGDSWKGIMTEYNDGFFLRKLNNAEFADILEKNCLVSTGAPAVGVMSSSDELLLASKVPSAVVNIGCVTSPDDSLRLADPGYIKKMAEGIYNGILEAFEENR